LEVIGIFVALLLKNLKSSLAATLIGRPFVTVHTGLSTKLLFGLLRYMGASKK